MDRIKMQPKKQHFHFACRLELRATNKSREGNQKIAQLAYTILILKRSATQLHFLRTQNLPITDIRNMGRG